MVRPGAAVTRVGVVADYTDERWPSMDLAADLLVTGLERYSGDAFQPRLLRPRMPRLARAVASSAAPALTADRLLGRYLAYPRWLRGRRMECDLFHVVDQSYAHLVHQLPAARTVVTCHDLDAFRSLMPGPEREPRSPAFRLLMRHVLSGLRRSARIICDAAAVRDELVARGWADAARTTVIPLPVHPDFSPDTDPTADAEADARLGPAAAHPSDLLHVSINVPRKGIDDLLRVFAGVRQRHPSARLVRAGSVLTDEQRTLAWSLGIADHIVELPFLRRPVLAAVYRRAALVLAPSYREGFGLPLVEAMACGTPVIASDLPVFREVGGDAVIYRPPGDVNVWVDAVGDLLAGRGADRHDAALARAAAFGLEAYTRAVAEVYHRVMEDAA